MRWEPAVYEHKARLIGVPVIDVSRSAELLTRATVVEQELYGSDAVTVGVDVYNVEAEACGAAVQDMGEQSCPDIAQALWNVDDLPAELPMPDVERDGRFPMIAESALAIRARHPGAVRVRVAASGPVSIASRLVGLQELVFALACEDESARRLLEHTTALACRWCERLRRIGLDVVVFDSPCAPPMLSPAIYRSMVAPLHARILRMLAGQSERPLIIGGDTRAIVADMVGAGANYVICDFTCPVEGFVSWPDHSRVCVRRNISATALTGAEDLEALACRHRADLSALPFPVAGTSVLPYDMDPDRVVRYARCLKPHLSPPR